MPGERPLTQAERRRGSMKLILDCAEAEFAQKGYNGATLAGVAEIANVDTALMRYYFGDKHGLFLAVFKRRAPVANRMRLEAMAAYRAAAGDDMTLEGIIDAFTRPGFEMSVNDEGWRNYGSIVAYVNSSRGLMHSLMSETYDEVSEQLVADMRRVLPNARDVDLYWGYHFLTGAYTFSMGRTLRIDTISRGTVSSHDIAAIAQRLPVALAAGIRAMCEQGALMEERPFDGWPAGAFEDEMERVAFEQQGR